MSVWELRCARINDFAQLVVSDPDDLSAGLLSTKGATQDWMHRPAVAFYVEPRRKTQKPRADVIHLKPGALVLNEKAKDALGPFLRKFGQLLELHCGGETLWFYNVTNMVACVDVEKSEKRKSGTIAMEAFDESKVPMEPFVFKDPVMAHGRIYVNDAGRAEIDRLAADAGLVGIECGVPQRF